jgi:hypothetical protein
MAADFFFDQPCTLAHPAGDERKINLVNFAFSKLRGQCTMRVVGFGNNETTARIFVQSVDDPGTFDAADG